jgi:hypothetical protein
LGNIGGPRIESLIRNHICTLVPLLQTPTLSLGMHASIAANESQTCFEPVTYELKEGGAKEIRQFQTHHTSDKFSFTRESFSEK